ncbi:MAG: hypothetical protein M9904_02465 [Chitinophagaceae bacterium]|nr:hypothetical protein [Chitinophagaceae bacterium]
MGFDDFQERKYCGIRNGKIIYKDDAGVINEKRSVSGLLTNVFVKRNGKYGPEFHIELYDKCYYHLQMFLNSGYARAFLCIMKNISPAQNITIRPNAQADENGKVRQSLMLYQDGQVLKWYYKKDVNGLPSPEADILKDKNGVEYEGWNYNSQTEFLLKAMEEFKVLLIPNKVRQRNESTALIKGDMPTIDSDIEDDLPF